MSNILNCKSTNEADRNRVDIIARKVNNQIKLVNFDVKNSGQGTKIPAENELAK